ncbi:MAG: STAS domain-containing protein [Chlorobiaceae bacterium]|jgi:anti-sigma B factor antagonist|nr:STAS domain-containing protein [Chlorobiaceae bacterium]
MIIIEKICHNITVVALQGTLDSCSSSQLHYYSSPSVTEVPLVIDLSNLDFLDSSGLGALVEIARKKREKGSDVKLACMNDKVRKVFEITQAYRLFDIYDDVEAAAVNAGNKKNSL